MKAGETKEECIVRLYLQNYSEWRIRVATGIRGRKVKDTIQYFQQYGQIPDSPKRGRPQTTKSNNTLLAITTLTLQNRGASCYALSKQMFENFNITISGTSVWRRKKDLGFNYRPPKRRQSLTDEQKAKRVKFAHSVLNSDIDFETLVFSDESRFCLTPDNYCIWMRKNEKTEDCFIDVGKYDVSIMVYGAIAKNYKSKLVVLDSMYGKGNYLFMQDGAPAHNSNLSELYLKKRCTFLKIWPANSPDLNPIEHLWGAMKRILKNQKFSTKEELEKKIFQIWESISMETINSLIDSFEGRLRYVIYENGESISDALRNGIHNFPDFSLPFYDDYYHWFQMVEEYDPTIDDEPLEYKTKRPWTPDEVEIIIKKQKEYGNKWSIIANYLEDRTAISVRNKFKQIVK